MKNREIRTSLMLGLGTFFLAVCFILFPGQVVHSSLRGLHIWWDVVFPATLPFFIITQLLMGFGVAHFFGVLLEPVMRPLFNVPGAGAFAMAMGFASGYPMGAILTAQLKERRLINRSEGERLVSFTSNSDPLFMSGAVAVGFFHDPSLGFTIMAIHYLTSILTGLIMRFHDRNSARTDFPTSGDPLLFRAVKAMHTARQADGRSFGKLLSDAVTASVNTLLLIGGLMIIFSVMIDIFRLLHLTDLLGSLVTGLFLLFGIPLELKPAAISGLFEVTLGAQTASSAPASVPMEDKLAVAGAILAWGGLSVHAQITSILGKTDLRYKPYLAARLIHTFLAAIATYLLWEPLQSWTSRTAVPAFFMPRPEIMSWEVWEKTVYYGVMAFLTIGMLFALSMVVLFASGMVHLLNLRRK